jgi:phage N-6-adenine-methyltransferase
MEDYRMTFRNGSYEAKGFDNWMTPIELIEELTNEFGELFDPCPKDFDYSFDGLEISWSREKVCFVNPPYSKIKDWVKKSHDEWVLGSEIILLIPARTDTRYFHDYINDNAQVRFIKGRLKFIHPDGRNSKSAPFPSILCIFRRDKQ